MKQYFYTILFLILVVQAQAQYVPNNAQNFQFISVVNPAFSGVEAFDDLKFGYRYQWAGFGSGSPKFINLSFNKRIKQPLDLSYNSLRLSDAAAGRPERLPRGKRIIHGIGANLFQSSIGILKSIGGSFNYSVNYPINDVFRIAGGGAILIENRKLSIEDITLRDPDEFYNHLLNSSTSQTDLNVRVGFLIYSPEFYIGASYLPLVNIPLRASELAMDKAFYRASVQTGYAFPLNNDVMLKPSIYGLLLMKGGVAMDYSVKSYIQNKILFGLTYRDIKSGVVTFGFNLNEMFSASYAYEISLGQFRQFNDGSHELVLAVRFRNYKKQSQYIW